jgi:hypothetical protein
MSFLKSHILKSYFKRVLAKKVYIIPSCKIGSYTQKIRIDYFIGIIVKKLK